MMSAVDAALATPGLWWLIAAALAAGLVRGFSGFGTAMIFLPVAGQVMGPIQALTVLMVMDVIGPLVNVPRAIRDGHPRDVARLGVGLFIAYPIGIALLVALSPEVFRYAVSVVALLLVAALISGFRYRGRVTPPMVYGVGLSGGFLGGISGIPGPPVILFYMARDLPAQVIRATITLYLILSDGALFFALVIQGLLQPQMLILGAALVAPYMLAILVGTAIFRPGAERTYRIAAYVIIALAALHGLPIFD